MSSVLPCSSSCDTILFFCGFVGAFFFCRFDSLTLHEIQKAKFWTSFFSNALKVNGQFLVEALYLAVLLFPGKQCCPRAAKTAENRRWEGWWQRLLSGFWERLCLMCTFLSRRTSSAFLDHTTISLGIDRFFWAGGMTTQLLLGDAGAWLPRSLLLVDLIAVFYPVTWKESRYPP